MDAKKALKELKEEIAVEMMGKYNASDPRAFEVSAFILGIIDRKIGQCDGE